ncbi:MAG: hypothetical protein RLZZ618_794 [Pseudomonadota bacterium]|jgi:hypothetical protein
MNAISTLTLGVGAAALVSALGTTYVQATMAGPERSLDASSWLVRDSHKTITAPWQNPRASVASSRLAASANAQVVTSTDERAPADAASATDRSWH